MNDVGGPALLDGHVQGRQDELGPEMGFHRPTDHAPAPGVEDDGEIQKPGPRRNVGDVGHPQLIGAGRCEVAGDEIRRRRGRLVSEHGPRPLTPTDTLCPEGAREPSHALASNVEAEGGEPGVDPRGAVRAARGAVDGVDVRGQLDIGARPRRQRPLPPRVVPTGGDTQHTAHGGRGMDGLVGGHELESFEGIEVVSRASQAAAFERMARSSRSGRFSRRSRRNSSRSSLVRPSVRWPASSAACFTQFLIAWAEGSNSRPSSSGVRPRRTNSIICRRNAGGTADGSSASWTPPSLTMGCPRNRVNSRTAALRVLTSEVHDARLD